MEWNMAEKHKHTQNRQKQVRTNNMSTCHDALQICTKHFTLIKQSSKESVLVQEKCGSGKKKLI